MEERDTTLEDIQEVLASILAKTHRLEEEVVKLGDVFNAIATATSPSTHSE